MIRMKYIERFIGNKICEIAKQFPVVMVTGSRQIGKTTILKHISSKLARNVNYVSLDDMNERNLAVNDPKTFLEIHKYPLIIDEFQYAPEILPYIKIIVDKLRFEDVKKNGNISKGLFFLTGSQYFYSMKNISESLAGRVAILKMPGLTSREIYNKKDSFLPLNLDEIFKMDIDKVDLDLQKLYERIFKGSYPEVWANKNINQNDFFSSYINTYIKRDINDLVNVKNELKFSNFITEIAVRTSQELNLSSIAKEIEISIPTAKEWLSILVSTGLVYLLEPYFNNSIKRMIKKPKIYFMDTGLACYLAKYPNPEILMNSAFSGAIFETYVVTELVKARMNNGHDDRNLYFYRDNNANEIDLIYEENWTLYPIEIKKSQSPDKNAIKSFKQLNEVCTPLKKTVGKGIVLCNCDNPFPINKDNYMIPISYI